MLRSFFSVFAMISYGLLLVLLFVLVDLYVSNVMLSVYVFGVCGFVLYVDNCGFDIDSRALFVVYYSISSTFEEGGAMVLFLGYEMKEVCLMLICDCLVLFVLVCVLYVVELCVCDVLCCIAASFWFVG